jgi:hypothetical protein
MGVQVPLGHVLTYMLAAHARGRTFLAVRLIHDMA